MSQYITKTIYLDFLACPKNAWLKLNQPELASQFTLSAFERGLMASGNLVEQWARKLFPKGRLIESRDLEAVRETVELINQKQSVIFQSTFKKDKFLVRNDVLEYDEASQAWNLYEIKGTNTIKENVKELDHIEDATFQYAVLLETGLPINQVFLIHLNKDYVRQGEIELESLFKIEDITDSVKERETNTRLRMEKVLAEFSQTDEAILTCTCLYSGRSNQCSTFNYSYPEVPAYSVHDLSRIGSSKKKLTELVDSGILDLNDIPDGFKLSVIQRNQVDVYQSQKSIIDLPAIKAELSNLEYPLYFLDYETYAAAIPLFSGYHPYQQITFQFSLHILTEEGGEVRHAEFLSLSPEDPVPELVAALKKNIGPVGRIIVWNKGFENSRNIEMAKILPQEKQFLLGLNKRVYDLIDVFTKQYYVHPGFEGKTTIKKVLPVMVPELSYEGLEIKEGGTASDTWYQQVLRAPASPSRKKAIGDLLKYCALDTYAMYAIWLELKKLIPA